MPFPSAGLVRPPDVMLVSAAVAFHAVGEFADTLIDVLTPDILERMFVAPVAGVATVVIAFMAGRTLRVVVTVQHEEFVVIKGGWRPFVL